MPSNAVRNFMGALSNPNWLFMIASPHQHEATTKNSLSRFDPVEVNPRGHAIAVLVPAVHRHAVAARLEICVVHQFPHATPIHPVDLDVHRSTARGAECQDAFRVEGVG